MIRMQLFQMFHQKSLREKVNSKRERDLRSCTYINCALAVNACTKH